MSRIIAVLTDFGNSDHYSGVMKGIILGIDNSLHVVDISNGIPQYSISSAAYMLYASWKYFPEDTIFLAVVDPGVGSERGILIGTEGEKFLVAPDNGIVSLILRFNERMECFKPSQELYERVRERFPKRSSTFHGRDLFAPIAAMITKMELRSIRGGKLHPITLPAIMTTKTCTLENGGILLTGRIMHIDHFGNCITSIHRKDMEKHLHERTTMDLSSIDCQIHLGKRSIDGIRDFFSQAGRGNALAYMGSSDFLEIAINMGNAARYFDVKIGDAVTLEIKGLSS